MFLHLKKDLGLNACRTYKGSKIEWDNDECAAALESPAFASRETRPTTKKAKKEAPLNRFQLLNMDDTEDSIDEDETSGIALPSQTIGVLA